MIFSLIAYFMEKETILNIISYAIRAPSTHNSQPWLFKIKTYGVSIYYDKKLKLPEADREGRDLYISIGCMLENMRISALKFGFKIKFEILIDVSTQHVADVSFEKFTEFSKENEIIFNQINKRVNTRGIFKKESIPNSVSEKIQHIVDGFNECKINLTLVSKKEDITKMAVLTQKAILSAYSRPSFRHEMSHWMNSNLSHKKQGIPGYSLNMSLFTSMLIPILIRYFNIGKLLGKLNLMSIDSSPMIIILSSQKNNEHEWIYIGMLAERIMLTLQQKIK